MPNHDLYPEINPFPYQGTLRISGVPSDSESAEADTGTASSPTLIWEPIIRLSSVSTSYLNQYKPQYGNGGRAVLIHGGHGSGKTHSIRFNMTAVLQLDAQNTDRAKALQIYVKVDGPNFLDLYKSLLAQIPRATLRDVTLRFLGAMTVRELTAEEHEPEVVRVTEEKLRSNPESVFEILARYDVEQGKLETRQARAIDMAVGGRRDFRRALSYLLSERLDAVAHGWILGNTLSEAELRQIGVSSSIEEPDVAKWGLQLIGTLLNYAGVPYIFYIDQYEKFVLDRDGRLISQNTGLLHSLVEAFPSQNGMLVAAGNNNAWLSLPSDLKQRFNIEIEQPELTLPLARQILQVYITRGSLQPSDDAGEESIYPFTEEAVRAMLRSASGNLRFFLQICSSAFDESRDQKQLIDQRCVEKVLKSSGRLHFDREQVRSELVRIVGQQGLRVEMGYRLGDIQVDVAVVESGYQPSCIFEIQDALFYPGEAHRALATLRLVETALDHKYPTPIVLIVLGYATQEVIDLLRPHVSDVIVYGALGYAERLENVLKRLRSGTELLASERTHQQTELAAVRRELEELARRRDSDAQAIDVRIEALLKTQASSRLQEMQREARIAWPQERERIENEIKSSRAKRRFAELDELERLRARAVMAHRRQLILGFAAILLGVFAFWAIVSGGLKRALYLLGNRPDIFILPILELLVLLVIFLYRWEIWRPNLVMWKKLHEIKQPVSSIAELDRLAGSLRPFWRKGLFTHPDPHVRYVVTKLEKDIKVEEVEKLLGAERSVLVRRNLIRRSDAWIDLDRAELPYLVDALASKGISLSSYVNQSARLLLVAILSQKSSGSSYCLGSGYILENLAIQLAATLQSGAPTRWGGTLLLAFREGFAAKLIPSLSGIPEEAVREAVRVLSPFEGDGLGTFDDLSFIDLIDKMYMFFRQFIFFRDRGLLEQGTEDVSG